MRRWVTGVAVVTTVHAGTSHGMTVNSFGSISLDPPLVTVTMGNDTRTLQMVRESGVFAITILTYEQQHLAELFAGRIPEEGDRLAGLDTFTLVTGAPLLTGGAAFIDCRVEHEYPMPASTLLIAEVLKADTLAATEPLLVYFNRKFTGLT
jgi:flavin reductase (DIM6/NTAB) family NADH-FMN oxidoreductase RutF